MLDLPQIASKLVVDHEGIWHAPDQRAVSYPVGGHQACFQVEESSFWFKHRNACILAGMKAFPPPDGEPIFDIGGGNGFVSLGLTRAGYQAVLVEPGRAGALNAKARGLPEVVCATTGSAGFGEATLGAIGLFDVIEHNEDDLRFLETMRVLLKPGGRLYATVPAYALLWSVEDELAGHFRRYTCESITRVMQRAGLTVDFASYFFRPLPIPIATLRALPYRLGYRRQAEISKNAASDHRAGPGLVARTMDWLLKAEAAKIAAAQPMRFGGSCLVIASAARRR